MHWAEQFVGLPYIPERRDCAALCAEVLYRQFGRVIMLPAGRAEGIRGLSAQIERHREDYGVRIATPAEGDAVLMIGRGRLNHIGIYCEPNGIPSVLHALRDAGQVNLHKLRELPLQGLQVEGFYRWK